MKKFNNSKPETVTVKFVPLEVEVDGDLEKALRKFKILFQRDRVIGQLKERRFYEKPSEKKRRKRREAYGRRLKDEMMRSGEWDSRKNREEDD